MREVFAIVLATQNPGKVAEFQTLLAGLPVAILGLSDALGGPLEVTEDGQTFAENALKKARAVADATRMVALGDDSGLEVTALGGRPGVRSARFAHERATDAENNAALLSELAAVGDEQRSARFRCVLSLVSSDGADARTFEGSCNGSIARAPRGTNGFGYDPLFVVEGLDGRTMAELTADEKNRVSHRGRAVESLRPALIALVNQYLDAAERALG
jgi:XTP/dITP diphosphohydrolase